jgi:hypothetical protein
MAPLPPEQANENASMHLHEVLAMEFAELHGEPPPSGSFTAVPLRKDLKPEDARKTQEEEQQQHLNHIWEAVHRLPEKRAALCISGGGIRSASFTLGVLQGLARAGLLGKFHYLSTVAGGGFIGGWLMAWILRAKGGLAEVLTALCEAPHDQRLNPEPAELQNLRRYSNNLSPRLSLLSLETWTLAATYFRNLLLNWLVLLPLLTAVLTIPWIFLAIFVKYPPPYTFTPFWLGAICLLVGVACMGLSVPSSRKIRGSDGRFLWFCLLPVFLGAFFMTIHWAWFTNYGGQTPQWAFWPGGEPSTLPPFLWLGLALLLIAWTFLGLRVHGFRRLEFLAVIIAGTLTGSLLWFVEIKLFPQPLMVRELYCCFEIPLIIGVFVVAINALTGLSSWTGDADREWWARATSWFLVTSIVWMLISVLLLFGTLLSSWGAAWTIPKLTIGSIAGALTLVAGRSSLFLAALKKRDITGQLTRILLEAAAIAALLFVAAILMNLTIRIVKYLGDDVFKVAWDLKVVSYLLGRADESLNVVLYAPVTVVSAVATGLVIFGITMACLVNPNTLSLHAMFRQRLIRTYLGASNRKRHPDPFTGFDEQDNPRMADLWLRQKFGGKLLPVINIAVNLLGAGTLAKNFTVSPLHCGSWPLGYRKTGRTGPSYGSEEEISGADIHQSVGGPHYYGGNQGISLGTAMTISGAALRSNKGYHSSPLVMFILSLLNFRLGVWLGNPGPAGDKTFRLASPKVSVRPLIAETFGLTNDTSPYVYLSDGRHFDSLGLYEMVMRRCHYIVVSDAGADPDFTFTSLAEAIRKIRFDFGIPIEFSEIKLYPRGDDDRPKADRQHCAIGQIRYGVVDGPDVEDGVLIYIKPVCYGDEPLDVYEYSQTSKNFPHESAGDQFFTESRLESYRRLGAHTMEKIRGTKKLGESDEIADFESLIVKIREHLATSDSDGPAADLKSLITKFRKCVDESDEGGPERPDA